jgi:hypothetical protein
MTKFMDQLTKPTTYETERPPEPALNQRHLGSIAARQASGDVSPELQLPKRLGKDGDLLSENSQVELGDR